MRFQKAVVAAAVTLLCSPLWALPARADAVDDAFLNTLRVAGLGPTDVSIEGAHEVCRAVWSGTNPWQMAAIVHDAVKGSTYDQAEIFVQAALASYCPPRNEVNA